MLWLAAGRDVHAVAGSRSRPAAGSSRACDLHRHKLADVPRATQLADGGEEAMRLSVHPKDETVEEDQMGAVARLVQIVGAEEVDVFDPEREAEPLDRLLV